MYQYWGKASGVEPCEDNCHLLVFHNLDVAACGHALLHSNPYLADRLATLMALPTPVAVRLVVFLLGIHDIGKFASAFQQLRPDTHEALTSEPVGRKFNYRVRHDTLGWMLWQESLGYAFPAPGCSDSMRDFTADVLPYWLKPVFGHHGVPPDDYCDPPKRYFSTDDITAARGFVLSWAELLDPQHQWFESIANDSGQCTLQRQAGWVIAGIAVLCDWLGSNEEAFQFCADQTLSLHDYWHKTALPSARNTVSKNGITPSAIAGPQPFRSIFPAIQKPSPLQKACESVPISTSPQLFILEDVTGAGKTEAAFMLAHRLISNGLGQGLYIGLPTMATANAMYDRLCQCYRTLFRCTEKPSLVLSHSARHLSSDFSAAILASCESYGVNGDELLDPSVSLQCNKWFADSKKKAMLAEVGIGTVDQALLSVLPARHQSLRLLGLATKVLILDEVHAYDTYTSGLLFGLLQFHAALGGSAILLTATLTAEQRVKFSSIYSEAAVPVGDLCNAYPLLTHVTGNQPRLELQTSTRAEVARRVEVRLMTEINAATRIIITAAVESGQCVCWIRNTVTDARESFEKLQASGAIAAERLHLFHSRYAMCNRLEKERQMIEYFGPASTSADRRGRVLIATQVIEQSLDLDFDVMISDLAPVDLLIQRAGRLQRHPRQADGNRTTDRRDRRDRRDSRGQAVLTVLSPPVTAEPAAGWYQAMFPRAQFVYKHTVILWRTAVCLADSGGWTMLDDSRMLLEKVYGEDAPTPQGLQQNSDSAQGEECAETDQSRYLLLKHRSGYTASAQWDTEARVSTRLGEESITVYLARWQGGQLCPWSSSDDYSWDMSGVRIIARTLDGWTPVYEEGLSQQLQVIRAAVKLFDEDTVIIPLQLGGGDNWVCAASRDGGVAKKKPDYCSEAGFSVAG